MKNIKSIIITLLFTSFFTHTIISKSISTSNKKVVAPTPPIKKDIATEKTTNMIAQNFKQLHEQIGAMKPEKVISKENTLSDYFINFVKDNAKRLNLPLIFTQALLETGRNLHMQLSQDNQQALQMVQKSNDQIKNIINALQSVAPSEKQKLPEKPEIKKTVKPVEEKKELSGIEKLQNFRKQSATQPLEQFYSQEKINQEWLKKALNLVLNGAPLISQNKSGIQGEVVGNATELIRELLHKNNITGQTRSVILESVEKQVIAFMDNQPLADQKQQQQTTYLPASLPIATKQTNVQPTEPAQKKPLAEPAKKSVPVAEKKPKEVIQLPGWISKEHTLVAKKFEIELLSYIFKYENATQEEVVSHFAQQIPAQIERKDIIINAIKVIVAKNFEEIESSTSTEQPKATGPETKTSQRLPIWIDIEYDQLVDEVMHYLKKKPDATNDDIFNYLMQQLPSNMPDKELIQKQVKTVIGRIFLSNEEGW